MQPAGRGPMTVITWNGASRSAGPVPRFCYCAILSVTLLVVVPLTTSAVTEAINP